MKHALTLGALLMLAACGSNEKSITIKDGDGKDQTIKVSGNDSTTTLKSEDGEAVIRQGDDAAKGASFPAFAPQYPGSVVKSSATFSGKDGDGGALTVQESSDDVAKVMAFYKEKITASGRKIAMETNTPEGGMMAVEGEGGKGGTMIIVGRDGDKTTITYTAGN